MPTTPLTEDEERDLASRVARGDQAARRRLILAHLRTVVGPARRFRRENRARTGFLHKIPA